MRRLITTLATVGLSIAAGLAAVPGYASSSTPQTIPALREWTAGGDGYLFGSGSRVVASTELAGTARTFAEDLRSLTGVPVDVVFGAKAEPGDIELRLGTADGGPEGYLLTVAPAISVLGNTNSGVFLGTRSVLQLLRQNLAVPGGIARDWPRYPERGLMVDAGRQYFSLDWLRQRVRELSYLKMNQLYLHLNDVNGFRLRSDTHPEVTSAQHYTKQEIRDLIDYAAAYQVDVIPELDFPGHLDPILAAHPDLKLVSRTGAVSDSNIDLSQPGAWRLMEDLITEFLPLFPSRFWHIGADEYVTDYADYPQLETYAKQRFGATATGKDAYHGYFNWANELVKASGKTARAHNDGLKPGGATVPVATDIIIEHWSMSGPPPWFGPAYSGKQLIAMGYRVQNGSFTPTHHTAGGWASPFNVPAPIMYDTWDPTIFVDGSRLSEMEDRSNLGSKLKLWCDESTKTERQLADAIHDKLRVMAQHTWRSSGPPLYLLFAPVIKAVGEAPA
ncbi:beta-N-acetylhexosaminidase [Amycolatopsis nigrescens]|uniref:beta-N-acetylhexosaminidase n=1 Tax=Amycolatopsis nigrescens TaxID=381445 RepID=UPI000379E168|nr:beta-N-acetylhexosaminidase [Amycolatopsis nigrescens]